MREGVIKLLMIFLLIAAVLMAFIITMMQTNVLVKHSGTEFTKSFSIKSISSETDGGYIRIARHDDTPIAYEWVRFDNNETYKFFSIDKLQIKWEKIYFDLPENLEQGKYSVNIIIDYISGTQEINEYSFWALD